MDHNRTLFIVNSIYQLMTALHLRRTFPEPGETELLLTDITPGLPNCCRAWKKAVCLPVYSAHRPVCLMNSTA